MLEFFIPGKPVPKARARTVRVNGRTMSFTPEASANYELYVKWQAAAAMAGVKPSDKPCRLHLIVGLPIPQSWSKKRQEQAIIGEVMPTSKPDLSNILKSIEDACNGVAYVDDSQLCEVVMRKCYAITPGVRVRISELAPLPSK